MWPPICTNFCIFVATTKKLNIVVESLHFPTYFCKTECKIGKRDGHEIQEMVIEKSWKNTLSSLWTP